MPVLTGNDRAQAKHDYLYWEFYEQGSAQAMRKGSWKAVRQPMAAGSRLGIGFDPRKLISDVEGQVGSR